MRAVPDPERLIESTEAPESLRAALCSARADTANARELRALAASLAPQLGPGGGGGGAGVGSAGAKAGASSLKWMLLSGVVVGGVALVVALRPNAPVAPADPPLASAPAVALKPPATPSSAVQEPAGSAAISAPIQGGRSADALAAPTPALASAPGNVVHGPRPPSKPAADADAAADRKPSEVSLLDAARKALQSNPRQALALTDKHRALYPKGMLAQEREVIAIEALRRMGATDAADQRNRAFDAQYPTTIHGRELQTESGGEQK